MTDLLNEKLKARARASDLVSSFIKKTYELLDDQKFTDIVDWNAEGTALIIKMPTEFGHTVLPAYFKHNNLTSFVRQLNMYDFHKRRTQKYDHVYYHDLFQRGKKHLLREIKRKNQDNTLANIQKAIETLETAKGESSIPHISTNTYENQLLKKLNKDALRRITNLEDKVRELTTQNQTLFGQITQQHQREDILVSFLANFMKKKGIALNQLPKVLENQFNLPHLSDAQSSRILCKAEMGSESANDAQRAQDQENSFIPRGQYVAFEDDMISNQSGSTQISPDSPQNKDQSQIQKVDTSGSVIMGTSGLMNYSGQDLLGKRPNIWASEDAGTLVKHVKTDCYTTPRDADLFAQKINSNLSDFDGLKMRQADNFIDFFNTKEKGIDLMDFSSF